VELDSRLAGHLMMSNSSMGCGAAVLMGGIYPIQEHCVEYHSRYAVREKRRPRRAATRSSITGLAEKLLGVWFLLLLGKCRGHLFKL